MPRRFPRNPLPLCLSSVAFAFAAAGVAQDPVAGAASRPLELGTPFGDHMVLQRDADVAVWGWAQPGAEVALRGSWGGAAGAVAGPDGRFSAWIATPGAGGPHELAVESGGRTITLDDVLVGEVWLCSGQSNMEWPLHNTEGGDEAVAAATDSELRLFTVERATAAVPQARCTASWVRCAPDTARSFSAVAYYFGARIRAELGVPVGLIDSSWGGTPCEAWTSAASLRRRGGAFDDALDALAAQADERVDVPALRRRWWSALEAKDLEQHDGISGAAVGVDLATWPAQAVPGRWQDGVLGAFDGVAWCARDVEIPEDWEGMPVTLELGPIDDMDTVYWNGERIGGHEEPGHWNRPRRYTVPADRVVAGSVRLAVRIVDTGGVGGIVGEAEALCAVQGDRRIPLAGAWSIRKGPPMKALGEFPSDRDVGPRHPTALFNGMIAPLVPFGVRGFLWYQGEANRADAWDYRTLFPEMIADWRREFGDRDMPFYFVQIAPYGYGGDVGEAFELREAQRLALALDATGMAVTMDIGNPDDIHPRQKRQVGERLAALALSRDYARPRPCEGPELVGMRQEGRALRLFFRNAEGLALVDGQPSTLRIAGADRVFRPAVAVIQGQTLLVSSEDVAHPVAVRHAPGAADASCLVNGAGLPASSFRTDAWPAITAR